MAGFMIGSVEPEALKTVNVKFAMKMVGDPENIIDCGSSVVAMDLKRSYGTLPVMQDDVDTHAAKNKAFTKSYDHSSNHTLGRGKTRKLVVCM